MKKSKRIIVLGFVLLGLCGCGKKEEYKEPTPQENKQTQIESKATVKDLEFELKDSKIENGTSEYTFEVTNVSNESKYIKEIQAIAKDSEGNPIITLSGVIESEIGSKEKTVVTCSYGGELQNVSTFTYEILN